MCLARPVLLRVGALADLPFWFLRITAGSSGFVSSKAGRRAEAQRADWEREAGLRGPVVPEAGRTDGHTDRFSCDQEAPEAKSLSA